MKTRFGLFRRGGSFYSYDKDTGRQESLRTADRTAAQRLVAAKNEAQQQPNLNLQIARVYLAASDGDVAKRTWAEVMAEMAKLKTGSTLERWERATRDKAFDSLRSRPLLETRAEHLLRVLQEGTISTNIFLRRMHNFAVDMTWLPWAILPKRQWPPVRFKEKRAITSEEHRRIIEIEWNPERRAFYELLWHLGGSQSDVANLSAEDFDLESRTVAYNRFKTGVVSLIQFSGKVLDILAALPREGPLFGKVREQHEKHRAAEFKRRCKRLGISGVTLHSYRYAWAERAKSVGFPERFAQQALGQSSKAVHRAYSKRAAVVVPSLEDYEENFGAR